MIRLIPTFVVGVLCAAIGEFTIAISAPGPVYVLNSLRMISRHGYCSDPRRHPDQSVRNCF